MMYLILIILSTLVLSAAEGIPVLTAMFETTSAIATVGVTLGITPEVSMVSKLVLAFLMIFGRAGSLTMLLAFARTGLRWHRKSPWKRSRWADTALLIRGGNYDICSDHWTWTVWPSYGN